MDTEAVVSRPKRIRNVINIIISVSGAVFLSYGVIHHGKVVLIGSFGFRDRDKRLQVESKTMFAICSLTKGLVTPALALLVQKGKLG